MDVKTDPSWHCGQTSEVVRGEMWAQSCVVDNGRGYAQPVFVVSNQSGSAATMRVDINTEKTIYPAILGCPLRTVTDGKQIGCFGPTEYVGRGKTINLQHSVYMDGFGDHTTKYLYGMK
ncbi:hypothetical protein [Streptomyces sp. MNP-20]|uniref:hypothetical protein n=1 Tax=Streptomyces sp. MNP-20 TaxID=2721165 RepID=UPI001556BC64|nr:hypothetical protein [Streptomyces sp. MNP-20]